MKTKGQVHVYTGTGKGKTTSAVGLGIRALGSGMEVYYASFHKEPEKYGYAEMEVLKKLGIRIMNYAKGHPHMNEYADEAGIKAEVNKGMEELSMILKERHVDLLIMDEILISVRDGYLEESELRDFIKRKPSHTELVLTGRGATSGIMELADYVSDIRKIKHPYDKGIRSRKGIEY